MAVSTDSTILQEEIDETYEPTEEEILEFASWLGMEFPQDEALLWIAKEGLKAPLPAEWKPCRTEEDEIYYFNFDTGGSSWDHPCDDFYRNLYKEESEKMQQQRHIKSDSAKISRLSPSSVSPQGTEQLRIGGSDAATEAAEPPKAPLVIKWKSAMKEPEQPVVADDQVQSREKSMQEEMLEKIKRELQEEGGNLVEQRRPEIIEEVERQIEMEKLRLREKHRQTMQQELEAEQEKLRQREVERRQAWAAKLKQEEEEASRMHEDLEARRKKREEDMSAQLEAEARSLRQRSQQQLEAFRMELKEEEARLMEQDKPEAWQQVGLVVEEMMVAMMKQVMSSLEQNILERELRKAREEAERSAWEARAKVESEVEREVAEFKEQMLKQRRMADEPGSVRSPCSWSSSCFQQQQQQQLMEVLLAALVARCYCCCSSRSDCGVGELRHSLVRMEQQVNDLLAGRRRSSSS